MLSLISVGYIIPHGEFKAISRRRRLRGNTDTFIERPRFSTNRPFFYIFDFNRQLIDLIAIGETLTYNIPTSIQVRINKF